MTKALTLVTAPLRRTGVPDALIANKLYADSGFPNRHGLAFNEPKSPYDWLQVRHRIVNASGSGFLFALIGPRGTGKTQIAQRAVSTSCANCWPALYARSMTFFLELQAAIKDETETWLDVIERYRQPRLLVLDEMQERAETDFENRVLNHLIDLRYGDMSDTLLLANLTPKALAESLGASIVDRLRETGGVIECSWPSFRRNVPIVRAGGERQ